MAGRRQAQCDFEPHNHTPTTLVSVSQSNLQIEPSTALSLAFLLKLVNLHNLREVYILTGYRKTSYIVIPVTRSSESCSAS